MSTPLPTTTGTGHYFTFLAAATASSAPTQAATPTPTESFVESANKTVSIASNPPAVTKDSLNPLETTTTTTTNEPGVTPTRFPSIIDFQPGQPASPIASPNLFNPITGQFPSIFSRSPIPTSIGNPTSTQPAVSPAPNASEKDAGNTFTRQALSPGLFPSKEIPPLKSLPSVIGPAGGIGAQNLADYTSGSAEQKLGSPGSISSTTKTTSPTEPIQVINNSDDANNSKKRGRENDTEADLPLAKRPQTASVTNDTTISPTTHNQDPMPAQQPVTNFAPEPKLSSLPAEARKTNSIEVPPTTSQKIWSSNASSVPVTNQSNPQPENKTSSNLKPISTMGPPSLPVKSSPGSRPTPLPTKSEKDIAVADQDASEMQNITKLLQEGDEIHKLLEDLVLEMNKAQDDLAELSVKMAILNNEVLSMNNPVLRAQIQKQFEGGFEE